MRVDPTGEDPHAPHDWGGHAADVIDGDEEDGPDEDAWQLTGR